MSTVVYKNAELFFGGVEVQGDFNEIALSLEAESLDATTFGNATRVHKGGLKDATLSGGGFWQAGANAIDPTLFESFDVTEQVISLYPDGITEGSTSTGSGYAFKAMTARYTLGGAVGSLLPFTVEAHGRGVGA